ncbi:MAG: hypothetical protein ACRC78_03965 [Planktothrix sp.]
MNEIDVKTMFAYKGAKRVVIDGVSILDRSRDDLFSEQEWINAVNLFIPHWEQWKVFLNSQKYKEGDYVIRACRMVRYSVVNENEPPLDIQEIEDRFIYPTVSLLGKIESFYPDREGYYGHWAIISNTEEPPFQSRYDDLIIISKEQYSKAIEGKLTCDDLKLPGIYFNYSEAK